MNNIITQEEKDKIDALCVRFRISNYSINPDGSIDVDGDVLMANLSLTVLPLRFGKVTGFFICKTNKLTSLYGCPTEVGSNFYCGYNQLSSLEYCPNIIGGDFDCRSNTLTTLKGSPTKLGGGFNCSSNKISSLAYCISTMSGEFITQGNILPRAFNNAFYGLEANDASIFIKYHHDYEVWIPEFNAANMNDLILDIKDGLR